MQSKILRDMARGKSLQAVYAAIAHLRQEGEQLTVASVARAAGVGRSTLYQDNDDWNAVMAVIDGGDIPPAVVVNMPSVFRRREPSRIKWLSDRIGALEKELEETINFADATYQRLVDQLQYYFAISHETPSRRDEVRKQRIELTATYEEIGRLKQEVRRLTDEGGRSNVIGAKGRKRHISIPPEMSVAKAMDHFLTELHRHIPDKAVGKAFTSITFVCGLPLSGKSTWIDRQAAPGPGTSLFIEGTLHTEELRTVLLAQVKRLCEAEVRCAWLLTGADECLRRAMPSNVAAGPTEELIRAIHAGTERVSVMESFDSLVGVR
ncbi:hypothetical protein ROSA5918_23805 [Roseateles saccharophilus]|uniref:Uncharacterized protein n=2 Tax=Roseateles saccharophilus TaxID=304 RepID=A0A4R3UC01_ROSSA|nr:hypothetical protein EV671_10522 [Roseateles saccharophilus]